MKPPKRILFREAIIYLAYSVCILLSFFQKTPEQNFSAVLFWLFLLLVAVYTGMYRYKHQSKLHKIYKAIEQSKLSPYFKEEGNSIIITYVVPSEKTFKEIKKIIGEGEKI